MKLLLKNLKWAENEGLRTGDICIQGGKISETGENLQSKKTDKVFRFDNHYLYRGLINSHDHLEMNLYPRMGQPPYNNYTEWARDIYRPNESPVKEIESIPIKYRLLWGGVKNLISGITTVIHHNPWHYSLAYNFPIRVLKRYSWAHSVAFEKKLPSKFPFRKSTPFIIHAAEGTDSLARDEISQLKKMGGLRSNTVLVHAVAADLDEIDLISQAGASVVWCPSSNYFMFNKTAAVASFKKGTEVALGSDSTMTGRATFLEEMQAARESKQATTRQIFEMASANPEKIFKLPKQQISSGFPADLLIVPVKSEDYYLNLFLLDSRDITAVLVGGKLQYADLSVANELGIKGTFQNVGLSEKWFAMDIARLKENILSNGIKESLFEDNALWRLLR